MRMRFVGVSAVLLTSSAWSTPVDDMRNGVDCTFALNESPYVISGSTTGSGTVPASPWTSLAKPAGSLNASVDIYALVPDLNLHATAFFTASASTSTTVKWTITAPGAIGQTVTFNYQGTDISVKISAITGELNLIAGSVSPEVDPTNSTVYRNVSLAPDTGANFLQVKGYLGGIVIFPVTFRIDPARYVGLAGNAPTTTISGKINLSDFVGDSTGRIATLTLTPSGGGSPETHYSILDAAGNYTLTTPLTGSVSLSAKVGHWLSGIYTVVQLGSSTTRDFTLENGDVDADDGVTVFDYLELSNAFDTNTGDGGYSDSADLDGDGSVTVFDYLILNSKFDTFGPIEQ
ncbi:MAG: hypothetical protein JST40_09590 [Armatimonadetes bacterium]|nr:hypothetical protein [Armatimonadota bacterium]